MLKQSSLLAAWGLNPDRQQRNDQQQRPRTPSNGGAHAQSSAGRATVATASSARSGAQGGRTQQQQARVVGTSASRQNSIASRGSSGTSSSHAQGPTTSRFWAQPAASAQSRPQQQHQPHVPRPRLNEEEIIDLSSPPRMPGDRRELEDEFDDGLDGIDAADLFDLDAPDLDTEVC